MLGVVKGYTLCAVDIYSQTYFSICLGVTMNKDPGNGELELNHLLCKHKNH